MNLLDHLLVEASMQALDRIADRIDREGRPFTDEGATAAEHAHVTAIGAFLDFALARARAPEHTS